MTGPIVSAHEDGDDAEGVPLHRCPGCERVALVAGRCPGCLPLRIRPRSLGVAVLETLTALGRPSGPAEVARRLETDRTRVGDALWRLAHRRHPPPIQHLESGLYRLTPEAP